MPVPLSFAKYSEDALFNPEDFLAYIKRQNLLSDTAHAPKCVILSYQRSLFDYVIENHPTTMPEGYFKNHLRYLDETDGEIAITGHFGIGAPAAAIMLEELIAFGVQQFISIGTAGALVKGLDSGELVICTGAFRDEGTSYHYVPGGAPALPDELLTTVLIEQCNKEHIHFHQGLTWTTDAIYRETKKEVEERSAKGALVVEMEASALFTVARYRKCPLAACFTISDSLAEPEWKPEFLSEETSIGLETLFRTACSVFSVYNAKKQ